jgi:hypothetical protein
MRLTTAQLLDQVADPATPAAGKQWLYVKSDGHVYTKLPSGTVVQVDGGSGSTFNGGVISGNISISKGTPQLDLLDTTAAQTTPNKYLRSLSGQLQVVNSAYSAIILSLTDGGNLGLTGTLTATSASLTGDLGIQKTGPAINLLDTTNAQATPNKYIRSFQGQLQIVNSAANTVIATLSDAGLWSPLAGVAIPTNQPLTLRDTNHKILYDATYDGPRIEGYSGVSLGYNAGAAYTERLRVTTTGISTYGVAQLGDTASTSTHAKVGKRGALTGFTTATYVSENLTFNGTSWLYTEAAVGSIMGLLSGGLALYAAPVGTVGGTATLTATFTVNATGNTTIAGTLSTGGAITVRSGSGGYANVDVGGASNTGHIDFFAANGIRQGFIGFSTSTAATQDTGTIPYTAATHAFAGDMTISKALPSLALVDTTAAQATPNKYMRSAAGQLQWLNSAASTAQPIMTLTDGGTLTTFTNVNAGGQVQESGVRVYSPGNPPPSTGLTATLANSTVAAETVVATWSLPANYLTANATIDLAYGGQVSTTATLTYRVRIGTAGTTADAVVLTMATTAAGVALAFTEFRSFITCLTTGTTGTATGVGHALLANSFVGPATAAYAAATINTTVALKVTITVVQSAVQTLTSRMGALAKMV